jgi:hypothetical protein
MGCQPFPFSFLGVSLRFISFLLLGLPKLLPTASICLKIFRSPSCSSCGLRLMIGMLLRFVMNLLTSSEPFDRFGFVLCHGSCDLYTLPLPFLYLP